MNTIQSSLLLIFVLFSISVSKAYKHAIFNWWWSCCISLKIKLLQIVHPPYLHGLLKWMQLTSAPVWESVLLPTLWEQWAVCHLPLQPSLQTGLYARFQIYVQVSLIMDFADCRHKNSICKAINGTALLHVCELWIVVNVETVTAPCHS